MKKLNAKWCVYLCDKKGQLYCGITTDISRRLHQHGKAQLLYWEGPISRKEASSREREIKGWRRVKKLKLIERGPGKCR
jgi:putative endonuclease